VTPTRKIACALLGIALALSLAACRSDEGAAMTDEEALAREKCTRCHSYGRVERARKDRAEWERTLDRMIGNGLAITGQERQIILDYLTERDAQ
jgi:hypothetical protein